MKRPAFFMACVVLAGAVTGRLLGFPPALAGVAAAALLAAALFAYARGRRQTFSPHGAFHPPSYDLPVAKSSEPTVPLALAALFCLSLFQQSAEVRRERIAEQQVIERTRQGILVLRGTIAAEPVVFENGERAVLVLRDVVIVEDEASSFAPGSRLPQGISPLACRVQVSLLRSALETFDGGLPFQGQRLEIQGRLRPPPEIRHPDLFDYRAFLRTRGIGALLSVWAPAQIKRVAEEDRRMESAVFSALMRWRRLVLLRFQQHLPEERAGVAQAMLLGETAGFDPKLRDIFIRTGMAHLFAVSGLHTAMLALMVFGICRLFQVSPRFSVWILFVFLSVYCVLVGFRAPVVRGSIMASCLAMPILSRRAVDTLTSLSIALLFTLLVNPLAILRTDFQFSYLCAFGLIVLCPGLLEMLRFSSKDDSFRFRRWAHLWNYWMATPLGVVIAAQLSIAPLLSLYFHQFSLIGFLANLVMVPFAALVLGTAWILAFLGSASPDIAAVLGGFLSLLIGRFISVSAFFSTVPGGAFFLPAFPWWLIPGYYLLLFSGPHTLMLRAPGALEKRRAGLLLRVGALAALLTWWPWAARLPVFSGEPRAAFQLTMLDVGQGDCFVLHLPNSRVLMVDTGRAYSAAAILEYLEHRGVDELDALVLTHGDGDHTGGAPRILEQVFVRRVIVGGDLSESGPEAVVGAAIHRQAVPVLRVARGDWLGGVGNTRLDVLNPADTMPGTVGHDLNERSVVLLVRYGDISFLLTGDAGIPAEKEMLEYFGQDAFRAEVLKVGHHGSRSSSGPDFLEAVRPGVALISAGARNPYGHPAPEVVERLEQAGAAILNTAVHGSVELRTDGRRLWIRTTRSGPSRALRQSPGD